MKVAAAEIEALTKRMGYYLNRWKNNPLAYVVECIGDYPTHQQAQALDALQEHKFIAIRSGHGVGKSKMLAWLIHWYLDTHRLAGVPCRVPCTGASASQLEDILWTEVSAIHAKKPKWLRDKFILNKEKMACKETKDWFAVLRTARVENPDALQGFHQCFYVIDEASGVPDEIFEVARGAMGDEGSMGIMVGNPTKESGYFYDQFHKAGSMWFPLHFSSVNSLTDTTYTYRYIDPKGEAHVIEAKGRQTRAWVESMKLEFGEASDVFKIRVLGEFGSGEHDTVIRPAWLDKVFENPKSAQEDKKVLLGVDVARSGNDNTAIVVRQGRNILHAEEWNGADLVESRLRVQAAWTDWKVDAGYVDTIGVGAGLYDELKWRGFKVRSVNVAEAPPDDNTCECKALRDWLWWQGRNYFRTQIIHFAGSAENPTWKRLVYELRTPTFTFKSGKLVVESKDEMKARGAKSPNIADAFLNTLMTDRPNLKVAGNVLSSKKGRMTKSRNWKVV